MSIDLIFWILTGFTFAFGAVVGSFLNVVIHRVPAGMSIVSPPSHCPQCENPIRWYDNIPIVSWALLLRGKCRHCAAPISGRYALVEALTGFLTAALWVKVAAGSFASRAAFSQTPPVDYLLPFGLWFVFICLLVVITFVDLEHLIIPHEFTLPGMALGVAAPLIYNWALTPGALGDFWPPVTLTESIIGLIAGGVTVVVIFYGYFAVRGVAGIGGGDVTLMALVGAWLGWPALIFVFFAASLQGTLAAAAAMLLGGDFLRNSAEIYEEDELREQAKETFETDEALIGDDVEVTEDVEMEATDGEDLDQESEDVDEEARGGLAVPFGPFISLAALEHFFLGDMLPSVISMSYLYQFGA